MTRAWSSRRRPQLLVGRAAEPRSPRRDVGGQAGAHQLLVRRVQAGEERVDALEESLLVEASGGRQDRDTSPIRRGPPAALGQLRLAQPPRGLRSASPMPDRLRMVVAPQLLAEQRGEQLRRRHARAGPRAGSSSPALPARPGQPAQQAGAAAARATTAATTRRQAGGLATVAEQADGRPVDRRRQLGVGEVPLAPTPSRSGLGADRVAQAILGRRLAKVERRPRRPSGPTRDGSRRPARGRRPRRATARGEQPLRVGPLEQERRTSRPASARRPPTPGVPQGGGLGAGTLRAARAEDRLQAQGLGRLATDQPRRGQVLEATARRRSGLSGGEPSTRSTPSAGRYCPITAGAAAQPQDVGRAHPAQLAESGREARRAARSRRSAADRVAHVGERLSNSAPHVHLALVAARGLPDVTRR